MGARIRGTHLKGHELQSAISQTLNTFREEINEVRAEAIAAEIPKALWKPPIEQALDTNGDGVIDAGEIANASSSLKKLDKNKDGKLTSEEYRPPRPQFPDDQGPNH